MKSRRGKPEVHATGGDMRLLQSLLSIFAGLLLLVGPAVQLAPCEEPSALVRYEATAPIMGCTFGVAAYGSDRDALARHVESAFEEARGIDGWLSNYRADSELSRLNRAAADGPVPVSQELFDLLAKAAEYSRATQGAFDMTVGPLVRSWGFYDGGGRVPTSIELSQARERVGYRLVRLDRASHTVEFARAGMELDPGGVGKGYAVDRMVEVLRNAGVPAALVNACHSSIYGLGLPPESPHGWPLEIEKPGSDIPENIFLKDQSLSTSGSAEKSFGVQGTTYSHILDPRSGRPAQGVHAVSVVAPTALDSEVWSTAVFVQGLEWASLKAPGGLRIYGCPDGKPCRWVPSDF
jgi:thiamine biosynthesis lipoprotein